MPNDTHAPKPSDISHQLESEFELEQQLAAARASSYHRAGAFEWIWVWVWDWDWVWVWERQLPSKAMPSDLPAGWPEIDLATSDEQADLTTVFTP